MIFLNGISKIYFNFMNTKILNFSIKFNKKDKDTSVFLDKVLVKKNQIKTTLNLLIGYENTYPKTKNGEYIKLKLENEKIVIHNDFYSSFPVYIYENKNKIILSNSIEGLRIFEELELQISSKMIYRYFGFGFIPFTSDTVYNNVSLMPPNSKIIINRGLKLSSKTINIFNHKLNIYNVKKVYEELNISFINKTSLFRNENPIFCLTSGLDSLLGSFLLKKNNIKVSTATFGSSNKVKDIIISESRASSLQLGKKHYKSIINDIAFAQFIDLSTITGGLSTSSNIYFYNFILNLKNKGKYVFYYCDHYEALRRSLKSNPRSIISGTTPNAVINKYFINLNEYNRILKKDLKLIHRYKFDPYMSYYLFEKYIKTTFYKNLIHNSLGTLKVTLPLDYNFLKVNNNYIRTTGTFSFKAIFNILSEELMLPFNTSENKKKTLRDFPFQPKVILKTFKNNFIEIFEKELGKELNVFFDVDKILTSLRCNRYVEKEEWFLLKLINLLIYKQKRKIDIY